MAAEDIDFSDIATFRRWVRNKPPEWAQAIAVRAALRVLPLASDLAGLPDWADRGGKAALVLATFRAGFLSWTARTHPRHNMTDAAASAASAITYIDMEIDTVARAAVAAAHDAVLAATAYDDVIGAACEAVENAALVGVIIVVTFDAEEQLWQSVRDDAAWLMAARGEPGDTATQARELMAQPLWLSDVRGDEKYSVNIPLWVREPLDRMADYPSLKEAGFGHWVTWYRKLIPNRRGGRPATYFGEALDIRIATRPAEWWGRNPKEVNADIAAWLEGEDEAEKRPTIRRFILDFLAARQEPTALGGIVQAFADAEYPVIPKSVRGQLSYLASEGLIVRVSKGVYASKPPERSDGSWTAQLAATEDQPHGYSFKERDGQLAIAASGGETDAEAASDPITQQLHAEVTRRASDFKDVAFRLDNQLGWRGIAGASSRLATHLNQGTEHVAEHIGEVWSDVVELGSFLEQDNALRSTQDSSADHLEPDARRQLESLISIASPWVRRFPTAVILDSESAAFLSGKNLIPEARTIVQNAKAVGLLRSTDADLLETVLDTAERSEIQGAKARTLGTQSSRNIVVRSAKSVVPLYLVAVLGAAAPSSLLVKPAVEFYLGTESAIMEIVRDMPSDIGFAYRLLIEKLKTDPPILPSSVREVRDPPTRRKDASGRK